jgi:DNA-binding response OmpR family regulator
MTMAPVDEKEKKQEAHPIKVLIADDDAPTRILLRAAVSQWGYEVVDASDGEEAWEILQKPNVPELMIVDWLMPKLDGIDLCRRIKAELAHRPYIILLTQLSGTTNIVKGLEAGANEFLSKPFNMAELQSRLSVGARIIKYQSSLALKNAQLKSFCTQVGDLSNVLAGISSKADIIIAECVKTNSGNAELNQQLSGLAAELKNIVDTTKQLTIVSNQDGEA